MSFPSTRLRRMRSMPGIRGLVRETDVGSSRIVCPLFVVTGKDRAEEIPNMPGVERMSIGRLVDSAGAVFEAGVPAVLLFGVTSHKDGAGTGAYDSEGVVQLAVRALKEALPELVVMTDLCLCGYTDHGHCGHVLDDGTVDNDITIELLAKTAISHAEAGADMVSPSDMMDGRVGAIRRQLDSEGYSDTAIVAHSAKFASAFYGPFRGATGSSPAAGDRRGYQMDPANSDEAVREARLDVEEGADMLMVKPALPYLDVVARLKRETGMPLAAYNVSGEYAMVKAGAAAGALVERDVVLEMFTSVRRAGADILVTYHAKDIARWLKAGDVQAASRGRPA